MILRRLAQHLREQNWTAIFIEFVLLILGVFLGIQVANWNENRQQTARQDAYMQRLRIDFTAVRDRIQQHLDIYRDSHEGGEFLLSIVRSKEGVPPASDELNTHMTRAYNALVANRLPPPLPATYVEMRSEGQLGGVRNSVLRDRLAEYDMMLGMLQEVARLTGDNLNQQAPVFHRYFVSRMVVDNTAQSGIRNELISYDIAGMRADRDFAVAIIMLQRAAFNSWQLRKRQLAQVEDILKLLDAETAR